MSFASRAIMHEFFDQLPTSAPANEGFHPLFLLNGNSYFPVAFIANRGFILSLFLGLMCLYEHHRWRSEKSHKGFRPLGPTAF